MKPMTVAIAFAFITAYVCTPTLADTPTTGTKAIVAVFDFAGDATAGADLAHRVRMRLRRHADRFYVLDHLTMKDFTPVGGLAGSVTPDRMAKMLAETVGATTAAWGDVATTGDTIRLRLHYLDTSAAEARRWTREFAADTERSAGLVARQVVEAITEAAEWTPPQVGDEAEPKALGRPLNSNGSFDAPGLHPVGWEHIDGISTQIVLKPGHGRVLRINTRLDRDQWLAWRQKLRFGQGDPATPPAIGPSPRKYGQVGAVEGVKLISDWIPASPGRRYWLTAEVKAPAGAKAEPKIFAKGYADFADRADSLSEVALAELGLTPGDFAKLPPARQKELIAADAKAHPQRHRRAVYHWYLNCAGDGGQWNRFAACFPPRGGLPANVKYIRLHAYAYWPAGEYLFDNIHLYADPRQAIDKAEMPARTPRFKPVSTVPAAPTGNSR